MIISFDLDNTLIPYNNDFEVYNKTFLHRITNSESIRVGTKTIFKELSSRNWEIWIYTTSFRSISTIRKIFWFNGLYPSRIINETINQKKLKSINCKASKNPNAYGIDIHVDDSLGVKMEGEKLGFQTIILETDDNDWVNTVLNKIDSF
jgi:hydroxymethylpyrimidine pyrophosphatase-like HAD family hydrolase